MAWFSVCPPQTASEKNQWAEPPLSDMPLLVESDLLLETATKLPVSISPLAPDGVCPVAQIDLAERRLDSDSESVHCSSGPFPPKGP